MKLRKVLCLIVAGVMLCGLMSGCISDDKGSSNDDPAITTAGEGDLVTKDNATALGTDQTPPLPVDDEHLAQLLLEAGLDGNLRFTETRKIKVELFDRGLDGGRIDPLKSYWTKWVQNGVLEAHNIEVEYQTVPRWSESTEISNILASGDAPDIMYTYEYPAIQTYAEDMHGILDMAPYVDDYKDIAPNFWDVIGPALMYFNRDPDTGTIWAIETYKFVNARINTFVRADWLEKLNISEPTTLEEFEAMLYDFQANAQTLLGADADKMVPFSLGKDVGWRADHLIASNIPDAITDKEIYTLGFDDRMFMFPGYKEGVRKLNEWFNAGLIWKDFALHGDGDPAEDNMAKAGYVGSWIHNWNYPYRDNENGVQGMMHVAVGPDARFVAVSAFKNDAGLYRKFLPADNDRKICFPATNNEPIASLLYLDWVSRPEVRSYLGSGEEGINFEILSDGAARAIDPTREEVRNNIFTAAFKDKDGNDQYTYAEMIINSPQNIDYLMTFNTDGNIYYKDTETAAKSIGYSYPTSTPADIERAFVLSTLDGRVRQQVSVGNIASEKGMGRSLSGKRDALLANSLVCKPEEFDAVWDNGFQDYLNSGGQAIIDERTAKWEQYFGDAVSMTN